LRLFPQRRRELEQEVLPKRMSPTQPSCTSACWRSMKPEQYSSRRASTRMKSQPRNSPAT